MIFEWHGVDLGTQSLQMEYMHMWHLSVHRLSKNKRIHFPGSHNIVNSYIDCAWIARIADKALWALCPKR